MKKLTLLLLASVIGLGACASGPNIGVAMVDEDDLEELVVVEGLGKSKTETGTLKAWATLRNLDDKKVMVEARAVFRGKNGEPIEAPSGWQQIFIEQDSTASFSALSMTDKAVDIIVELREGNR